MRRLMALPTVFDLGVTAVAVVLTALVVWPPRLSIGTPVVGPLWARVLFTILIGVPLAWRRRAPVAAAATIIWTMALHGVLTADSAEGAELLFALSVGVYSLAAYSRRRRAWIGLAVVMVGYVVYTYEDQGVARGDQGDLWAAAFFALFVLAWWLVGMFVRHRRDERISRARAAALEEQVRTAVDDERARLARELHDVVSHNLSVVVLQAAGARAAGTGDAATLEKIERSGRESLVEMRRLLGVLRRDHDDPDWAPQPGIAGLDVLVAGVRSAGLAVELRVDGDTDLPKVIDLCVYRIVQEALTNALKHAGPAQARVAVRCDGQAVTIDVEDDGYGHSGQTATGAGHGLIGMRERVALFGGELVAGPRPGRGFAVHVRLPRDDAAS